MFECDVRCEIRAQRWKAFNILEASTLVANFTIHAVSSLLHNIYEFEKNEFWIWIFEKSFFLLFQKNQVNSINQQLVEKSKLSYLWTDFARVWSIWTSGSIRKRTEIGVWPWRSRSLKVTHRHYMQNVRDRMGNNAVQVELPSESRSRSSKVKNILYVQTLRDCTGSLATDDGRPRAPS